GRFRDWPPGDRRGCRARLFERIWDRFEADFSPEKSMMRMHRAIPNRIDAGIAAAAFRIDDDPIAHIETGLLGKSRIRHKAYSDQHKVGGEGLPAFAFNPSHGAVPA